MQWLLVAMCLTVALQHIYSEAFSSIGGVFQPQLFCKHRPRFIGRNNRLSRDSEGRILTSKIKSAKSAKKVLAILDKTMNQPFFNKFHASAAYTSLTAMKRKGFRQQFGKRSWDSCVLSRLNDRVRTMILENQLGPREGANIFWSIVHLRDLGPIVLQLLGPLVEVLPGHAGSMNTQQLANCLWAAAHLHECGADCACHCVRSACKGTRNGPTSAFQLHLGSSQIAGGGTCPEDGSTRSDRDPGQRERHDPPSSFELLVGGSATA